MRGAPGRTAGGVVLGPACIWGGSVKGEARATYVGGAEHPLALSAVFYRDSGVRRVFRLDIHL